ncbi:MAG TPA: four helix bundle protein [Gemmatimonadales bacterium]|nr:four helix bundle protein [Gemmatimonadales bacterium]
MQDFRRLTVWQRSHALALDVYRHTRDFPKDEQYGLSAQARRAASSVCANLAEGCGRGRRREFGQFVRVASGSASELECHLLLAADLGFVDPGTRDHLAASVTEVKRMLWGLQRALSKAED